MKERLHAFDISGESWGSVRKVRFKSQIYALIKFAVENHDKRFYKEDIRRLIQEDRTKREYVRLLVTQTGPRRALRTIGDREGSAFKIGGEDTIAFAKAIGLFEIKEGVVVCPSQIRQLYELYTNNINLFESEVLCILLNSKYPAYSCFLVNLQELGGDFHVPHQFRTRTKKSGLKDYLYVNGFFTDSASFYTMRDLFYEFGLLNWRVDSDTGDEHIYLTCQLVKTHTSLDTTYIRRIDIGRFVIFYDKSISQKEFENVLSNNYRDFSGGFWGTIVDLLDLRDRVSAKLHISDDQFNRLLVDLWKEKKGTVELSQGTILLKKNTSLLIKGLSAPMIGDNQYATYIRLQETDKK